MSLTLPTLPEGGCWMWSVRRARFCRLPVRSVDPADPAVVQLCADLVATMRVSPGCVGLAAPQVGVAARAFCVDVSGHPKTRTDPRSDRAAQPRNRGGQSQREGSRGLHVGARPHG